MKRYEVTMVITEIDEDDMVTDRSYDLDFILETDQTPTTVLMEVLRQGRESSKGVRITDLTT